MPNSLSFDRPIIFIGDIHGRIEPLRKAAKLAYKINAPLISVGDIFDSYDQSIESQFICFRFLIDLMKEQKAIMIPGNHDLAYVYPYLHSCSGNKFETKVRMSEEFCGKTYLQHLKDLDLFIWIEPENPSSSVPSASSAIQESKSLPLLVTHAGLTLHTWELYSDNTEIKISDALKESFDAMGHNSPFFSSIGKARGGNSGYGGIFWCDFDAEFVPISGLNQVFGHTRSKKSPGIRQVNSDNGTNFCIDCLDIEDSVLILENNEFRIHCLTNS